MSIAKILLVDDDHIAHDIVAGALSSMDVDLLSATSADIGLQLALEHRPDLIVMDLMLPSEIKGWDAIATLKADDNTRDIPVIAFTAAGGHIIQKAMTAGADDFLQKPFSITHFKSLVLRHIGVARE